MKKTGIFVRASDITQPYNRTESIFGTWPPERIADSFMSNKQKEGKKFWTKTTTILILALVTGFSFILWSINIHESEWGKELTLGLGIAGITAGILGLAVDRVLAKDLANEAVQHTLGYHFPEGLRGEIRRLYEVHFLATRHESEYNITPNSDNKTVTLDVKMTRKLSNFTNSAQELTITHSVDQIFSKHPTRIEEISYWLEGDTEQHKLDVSNQRLDKGAIEYEGPCIKVPKGSWIQITTKHRIIKMRNDVEFMVLNNPTVEPEIIVTGAGFDWRKGYTHPDGTLLGEKFKLDGTLLPRQAEYVRWWPKDETKTTNEEANGKLQEAIARRTRIEFKGVKNGR